MSSIVPYVSDLLALRRVPAPVFGTFTSINPVWAALAGWLLLRQALDPAEWISIGNDHRQQRRRLREEGVDARHPRATAVSAGRAASVCAPWTTHPATTTPTRLIRR
jgi:hypothetical protein